MSGNATREKFIGASVLRKEDESLLNGSACFSDDFRRDGTLQMAVLRSTHAHAEIRGINVQAARSLPGISAVFTAADLPSGLRIPMRMFEKPGMERFLQPPLAEDKVRYSGEPVAVVVGESRYVSEDALELIEVDYEPLEPALGTIESIDPEAPLLFEECGSNLTAEFTIGQDASELETVFAEAEVVVSELIEIQRHGAVPIETRGISAFVDETDGRLIVHGMSKIVHINRKILSRLLEWPADRIRMVELHVGGGFGARGEFYPEDFLVPWAAIELQRPVNWTEDREEHLRTTNHSREQVHEISLALDQDGRFLGLRDRVTFNTGAYVRTHGVVVPNMTAALLPGPYLWGAYSCEVRHVVTNKTPAGTYRAPGRYEANFARERMIDITARRIGEHPDDLRRRNLIGPELMPFPNGTEIDGHAVKYDSGDYPRLFQQSESFFGGEEMEKWRRAPVGPLRKRGIGSAFFIEKSGIAKWDYARVEMGDDGRPTVFVGSASIGQGVETVIAQICADALGVRYDDIAAVRHGDTDEVPEGMGSFGSRATMIAGSAVFEAAEELRRRLLAAAAQQLEASETDLSFDGARVIVNGSPSRFVELSDLRSEIGDEGLTEEARFVSEDMSFPYGIHRVAVEVDVETGALEFEKYSIAYDVGRAINPMLIDGQIVGGAAQGIGGATLEEFTYDEQGQLVAGSFIDYLLPTATEIPKIEVLLTEDAPTPLTPVGAKGAGEGGTAAAGAAIANAVCDALDVEVLRLPLTPERVRRMALDGN